MSGNVCLSQSLEGTESKQSFAKSVLDCMFVRVSAITAVVHSDVVRLLGCSSSSATGRLGIRARVVAGLAFQNVKTVLLFARRVIQCACKHFCMSTILHSQIGTTSGMRCVWRGHTRSAGLVCNASLGKAPSWYKVQDCPVLQSFRGWWIFACLRARIPAEIFACCA